MSESNPVAVPVAIAAHSQTLPPILKAEEVASLLRINRKTLYEAVQRGEVPGVIKIGRSLRFRRDDLLLWASQGRLVPHPGNTR